MNLHQLAVDEPLSPELVLVLPPEYRAVAIARLGPPTWPAPAPRPKDDDAEVDIGIASALGELLYARLTPLVLIFVAATLLTLVLSEFAQALR